MRERGIYLVKCTTTQLTRAHRQMTRKVLSLEKVGHLRYIRPAHACTAQYLGQSHLLVVVDLCGARGDARGTLSIQSS